MYIQNNSLSLWLKYIEKLDKKIVLNLKDLKYIAKKLNVLDLKAFIFTISGTNGKGSTCFMLEKFLLDGGYKVGLYTSPHLISYLERVRINGCIVKKENHISAFKEVELARGKILLSSFEFITLTALLLFKKHVLDIIILEVGIGGRLDATNIIDSNLSIITNISLEHINFLGTNRCSIAREKSGIFRSGKIAIIGEINIPDSINNVAKEKNTILKKNNIDWFCIKKRNSWSFKCSEIELYDLPFPNISLSSASIALSALYYGGFKVLRNIIKYSLKNFSLIGRFQCIHVNPRIIIDVAHNPDAVFYLSKKINTLNIFGDVYAIFGVLKDKDILGMINFLKNQVHYWYSAPLKNKRTATLKQLRNVLPQNNSYFFKSISEAWFSLKYQVQKEDIVLVFGSFLTISEFIKSNSINLYDY